jgi:hypothetical protein
MNFNEMKEIKMSASRARGVLWKCQHTAVPHKGTGYASATVTLKSSPILGRYIFREGR